jgi:hypothetical protein
MLFVLSIIAVALAALPCLVFLWNFGAYERLRRKPEIRNPKSESWEISLLIPARNEERSIEQTLTAALANRDVDLEVIVLDDNSTDRTAEIVRSMAEADPRVRLETAPPLPDGWCGKQHACYSLSQLASHELMVFIDADVTLSADALGRIISFMNERPWVELASGFPRQLTGTLAEKLVIPLITYVLLGYLPLRWSRVYTSPGFGAGCGQLFIARKTSYQKMGGHSAIRTTLHDGVKLPREYRKHSMMTDLFDGSDIASCRMYRNAREVWAGLTKNSVEGLGSPGAIWFWTFALLGAAVLPWIVLAIGLAQGATYEVHAAIAAIVMGLVPRLVTAVTARESWLGAILHPVGILILIAVQWTGLIRHYRGQPQQWKGRAYPAQS